MVDFGSHPGNTECRFIAPGQPSSPKGRVALVQPTLSGSRSAAMTFHSSPATRYRTWRYDGYEFKVFVLDPRRTDGLSGTSIAALFKDRSGALWIGRSQILDRFDPRTETFTHYRIDSAAGFTEPVIRPPTFSVGLHSPFSVSADTKKDVC
jgi:hypothetical protein